MIFHLMNENGPLAETQQKYAALATGPLNSGVLKPVFNKFATDPESTADTISEILEMILSIGAQLEWRLSTPLRTWYWKIFLMVCPDLSKEQQEQVCTDLFDLKKQNRVCCLDEGLGQKVVEIFAGPKSMKGDPQFVAMIDDAARVLRMTNMELERLLAQVNAAVPRRCNTTAERVCAGGSLSQILRAHLDNGGSNPVAPTLSELIEDGVPLFAAKTASRKKITRVLKKTAYRRLPMERSGVLLYANYEVGKWQRELGRKLTFKERNAKKKELCFEFKNLSQGPREYWNGKARARDVAKKAEAYGRGSKKEGYGNRGPGCLLGLSDKTTPLRHELIKEGIERSESSSKGYGPYQEELRAKFRDRIFCEDKRSIPKEKTFVVVVPCEILHPGICRTVDQLIYGRLMKCVHLIKKAAEQHLKDSSGLFWCRLYSTPSTGTIETNCFVYLVLAYCRKKNPREAIFVKCTKHERKLVIAKVPSGLRETFAYMHASQIAKHFLPDENLSLAYVHIQQIKVDITPAKTHGYVEMLPESEQSHLEVRVHDEPEFGKRKAGRRKPKISKAAKAMPTSSDDRINEMLEGLKGTLEAKTARAPKKLAGGKSAQGAVRVTGGKVEARQRLIRISTAITATAISAAGKGSGKGAGEESTSEEERGRPGEREIKEDGSNSTVCGSNSDSDGDMKRQHAAIQEYDSSDEDRKSRLPKGYAATKEKKKPGLTMGRVRRSVEVVTATTRQKRKAQKVKKAEEGTGDKLPPQMLEKAEEGAGDKLPPSSSASSSSTRVPSSSSSSSATGATSASSQTIDLDWYLVRSGRQAACKGCSSKIGPWEMRIVYEAPEHRNLGHHFHWKYYHIDWRCLKATGIRPPNGRLDSHAVRYLPQKEKENLAMYNASVKEAREKVYSECQRLSSSG